MAPHHQSAFTSAPSILRTSTFTQASAHHACPVRAGSSSLRDTPTIPFRSQNVQQNTRQNVQMTSGLPDFDEIAKQLQQELQVRRMADASNPAAPMPNSDAPPSEQPIEVTVGNNDMPKVILRHAPSDQQAEIYSYGACVTSWTTRGENHFWVSDTNKWELGGKAIRGGIPICFPQFGPYGDLVQHGFARISQWSIRDTTVMDDGSVTAIFYINSEMEYNPIKEWPYKFEAQYTVTLSYAGLETKLTVTNKDDKPFDFTFAFHNYFKTSDVKDARVFGYEEKKHLDRLNDDKEMPEQPDDGAGILLESETDRIYMDVPEELAMFDYASLKVLKIKKTPTLQDATLWNPYGAEGADPGWNKFICIEPACITKPAILQPNETWVGAQLLGVE